MLDLGRTFLQSVERSPNEVALVDRSVRLTYAEWCSRNQDAVAKPESAGRAGVNARIRAVKSPVGKVLRRRLIAGDYERAP
jgi:hypothetical protein